MVKCKDCEFYYAKYEGETIGQCTWELGGLTIPISWVLHLPTVIFVSSEREHSCGAFENSLD